MGGLLRLLVLGGVGYGAYRLLSRSDDSSSGCVLEESSLDAWANSFEPSLGVLYFPTMEDTPPPRNAYQALPAFPGDLVVINRAQDFYVYDANGDPQLSPNLKGDYCARYG